MSSSRSADRYIEGGFVARRIMNPFVAWLVKRGVSFWGARVLRVRGRLSGEWREVPVNLHNHNGVEYLVAPRGTTQWVRNLRAAGGGQLQVGRRIEGFSASEVADAHKAPILRAYLRRWGWEAGAFFEGVTADASDEELAAAAPRHPVFQISRG